MVVKNKSPRKKKVGYKKPTIRNKAPKGKVPNIGNSTSAGMWGY